MKKVILPLIPLILTACFNMDSFVTPVVFKPSRQNQYLLGAYGGKTELGEYNTVFPDTGITLNQGAIDGKAGKIYYVFAYRIGNATGKTIFYCHGNTDHIDNYWPRVKILYQTGYNVFIFDYRGFGQSEGEILEQGMLEDTEAGMEYMLDTLNIPVTNILIYGYSLGTVPATHIAVYLAEHYNTVSALGLVLEAPVGSTEIYVQDATFLPLPSDFITRYKLDNVTKIKQVTIPFLWLHGKQDTTNRWDTHGQAVFDNYGGTTEHKYARLPDNATHSNIPVASGGTNCSIYIQGIRDFMDGKVPFAQ